MVEMQKNNNLEPLDKAKIEVTFQLHSPLPINLVYLSTHLVILTAYFMALLPIFQKNGPQNSVVYSAS